MRLLGQGGALVAFLVALGTYSNSLHGEFVFDDTVAIVGNDDVKVRSFLLIEHSEMYATEHE